MDANVIWTATYEWLEIATREGLDIDWAAEPVSAGNRDDACRLCGFDANDEEVGFGVLNDPRPQDTLLRKGDIVATSGYGEDVVFLRLASTSQLQEEPPRWTEISRLAFEQERRDGWWIWASDGVLGFARPLMSLPRNAGFTSTETATHRRKLATRV